MNTFKPNMIKAAMISSGLAFGLIPQAVAQSNQANSAEEDVEIIQVSGIRASLQKAQAIKMSETSIVEVITAEDIGKLPDSSIAESLARLPGLAAQRLDGRASSITIRGLGEDFSATTFNGREQVSLGDNRGVEFDVYPSEIMNEVVVYKTPDASLITQGIGGTIDMRTVKPLAFGKQNISFTLRGENNDIGKLNPDGKDTGYRGSFSYIDQFSDDTVGIAIAYAHMKSPVNEERFNTWGYPGGKYNDQDIKVIGGFKPYVRSAELTRDTIMGVLELAPNDKLKVNIDALYIDFKDDQRLRGAEIPAAWGDAGITVSEVSDGQSLAGTIGSDGKPVGVVVRNDVTVREADLTAVGANVEYLLSDDLTLEFDASYSKTDRKTWALEAYAGSGRGAARKPESIDFRFNNDFTGVTFSPDLNYGDDSIIKLGNPQSWGYGNLLDPDSNDDQDGFINTPTVKDELTTLKLAAEKVMESGAISSVEFGVHYSDREKSKVDTGLFLTLPSTLDANSNVIPGSQMAIPAEYRLPNVSLGFIGFGEIVAFDSFRFWQDGNYKQYDSRLNEGGRWANTWTVNEKALTGFVKVNIEAELGDIPIRGNFGLQAIRFDQSSDGYSTRDTDDPNDDPRLITVQPAKGGDDYTELLPSVNLIADVAEDQIVRLGFARTLSRSRMDRMHASSGKLGFDTKVGIWSGGIANPSLRPIKADQFDITYENYFHEEGYVAVAYFYKSLSDWQLNLPTIVDTSKLQPPTGFQPAPFGVLSSWQNVGDGKVSGTEISLSLTGGMFTEALEGLGGIFSATFLDSSLEFDVNVPTDLQGKTETRSFEVTVPGLSDEVFNATVYYERAGFEARVSWRSRSDFLGEVSGLSLNRVPVNVRGSDIVDAQISYDFSESDIDMLQGLTVTLQAQNLTDEKFITDHSLDDPKQVRDVQRYGRNYLFGINYQF